MENQNSPEGKYSLSDDFAHCVKRQYAEQVSGRKNYNLFQGNNSMTTQDMRKSYAIWFWYGFGLVLV